MEVNTPLTPATNQDRLHSLDRANKMSVLFRKENFVNVMMAVELYATAKKERDKEQMDKARNDFIAACGNANLKEDQTIWLWNYLSHYKQKEESEWERNACPGGGW